MIAKKEFDALHESGRAALLIAIRDHCAGRPVDVSPLRDGLMEIRVQVGTNPYRAIFFRDSPVHDVCVVAFYKNQRKTPREVIDRAKRRMKRWQENGANR